MSKIPFWQIRFDNPRAKLALLILPMVTMISIGLNIQETYNSYKYSKWLSTKGIILESKITERQYFAKGRTHHQYRPRISYKYSVNGQPFTNDVLNPFSGGVMKKGEASTYIEKYVVGQEVIVYHSKIHPYISSLEKHMPSKMKYGYLITPILILLNIGLFSSFKKWEDAKSDNGKG
jgi:Protein of unknown function (DUF3592)